MHAEQLEPDPEGRERLYDYCGATARSSALWSVAFRRCRRQNKRFGFWISSINTRGFHVDRALADAARKLSVEEQKAVDRPLRADRRCDHDGEPSVADPGLRRGSRASIEASPRNVAADLAHDPEADVERLLELRRDGSNAAARKLDSLLAGIEADDRLRGTLRFHGAATGRWCGYGFQPQNLKKSQKKELDTAIDAILAADLERVRKLGAPLSIIGDVSRGVICAARETS